jgi:hypothetical protein
VGANIPLVPPPRQRLQKSISQLRFSLCRKERRERRDGRTFTLMIIFRITGDGCGKSQPCFSLYFSDLANSENRRALALRFISSAARLLSSVEIWIFRVFWNRMAKRDSVNLDRPGISGVEMDEISARLI